MNKFQRNMTVSAAALVAALVMAPKSEAQERFHGREGRSGRESRVERPEGRRLERREGRVERPEGRRFERREEFRGNRFDRDRGRDRRDFNPAPRYRGLALRPYAGFRSYGSSPFRVFGGMRFYSDCPGPGYVYISDGDYEGWVYPPYLGAIWLPGHYDRFGIWFGGRWR